MTQPLFYWEQGHVSTQPRLLRLLWQITAAKTVSPVRAGLPALPTFDAYSAQATIDDYLGTSSEFTAAQFDATSMDADAFGAVVRMAGQCKSVDAMIARCYSGTAGATLVELMVGSSSVLTDSTLETAVAVGADGNIGFKCNFGNTPDFDGLTAGYILVDLLWHSK